MYIHHIYKNPSAPPYMQVPDILETPFLILVNKKNKGKETHNGITFRMGREDTKVMTAIRSLGKTNCPFGLFMSEQTCEQINGIITAS